MHRLLIVVLLLLGCQTPRAAGGNATLTPPARTATPAPSAMPSATPTRTVEQAIQPFTIAGLRQHDFRSGAIKIQALVHETDVFRRYIIEYPSDGLRITGVMQIPVQGKSPYPVLILNHGFFARTNYSPGDGTDRAAEYFNRHGYLTLSSDYRSWGGSDVGPSLFYSGLVIDVVNLMNAIPSVADADVERIGMLGHSMGGGVTMKVLAIDNRVRAAALYSTVSADDADLIGRWGAGCIGDVFVNESLIGCNSSDIVPSDLPPDLIEAYQKTSYDAAVLAEVSPIFHLENISAPIQIGYGTEDGEFLNGTPPEWSRSLHAALLEAGKPAEIFAYEGEGHSFIGDQWVAFMERTVHFFDRYVKEPVG